MSDYEKAVEFVRSVLVEAESTFREDRKHAYERTIKREKNEKARQVLKAILKSAEAAEGNHNPFCDDTGISRLVLKVGPNVFVTGGMLDVIGDGATNRLEELPNRPMGVVGGDNRRVDRSGGLNPDPAGIEPAPILLRICGDNTVRLHIMMFGGGPVVRVKTYGVFHEHNTRVVIGKIMRRAVEGVAQPGRSPCTLTMGIGCSHFEAASMMLQAQTDGYYGVRSEMEAEITRRVNESDVGPLRLHGRTSIIVALVKVGPQRASGVRIVCVGSVCCFKPKIAIVDLIQ